MKKVIRNLAAITLAGAMMAGTGVTAYAADVTRDDKSQFTNGPATGAEANTGIDSFNLIKDYDSVNLKASDPKSKSPADTFTYTITPYAVWNAGNTTATNTISIDASNMPLLSATANSAEGKEVTSSLKDRTLTITQNVPLDSAIYEESNDRNATEGESAVITLPTYRTVGDYWYKVVESHGTTTGVLYGTNSLPTSGKSANTTDSNGNYSGEYFIHVQVTETKTTADGKAETELKKNVTMHTSAPDAGINNAAYNNQVSDYYVSSNKVNAIENQYYAGDLVIKKEVTGNAGDKDEYFPVTVTFTKPAGTIVNSDISFTATFLNEGEYVSKLCTIVGQYYTSDQNIPTIIKWTNSGTDLKAAETATTTFFVKDNTTVTFSNIPYGIKYTVQETVPDNDTYQNKITFTNSKDAATYFDGEELAADTDSATMSSDTKTASGSISDERDEITIENYKNNSIDIGVLLSNAPYIALLGVAGAGAAVLVRRKRRIGE